MSAKDRRSRDQKRKAQLAERARRQPPVGALPYDGRKYRTERWVPHVFCTERAIHETIGLSGRQLTDAHVREALVRLVGQLRAGPLPPLPDPESDAPYAAGQEADFLIRRIRRHWDLLFQEHGPVRSDDLIGILRTLLSSMEAHPTHAGIGRGYLAFLESFMQQAGQKSI